MNSHIIKEEDLYGDHTTILASHALATIHKKLEVVLSITEKGRHTYFKISNYKKHSIEGTQNLGEAIRWYNSIT